MKRFLVVLLVGTLVVCGWSIYSSQPQPIEKFETAVDLVQYWSNTEYPSYICGVFVKSQSHDKTVVAFGITDDEMGRAGRDEILTLIRDKSTAFFVTQKYTYAQMFSAKEDLMSYLTSHYELLGEWNLGIRQSKNYVYVNLWENEKNLNAIERFKNETYEKYGDMVHIGVGEPGGGLSLD